MSAHLYCEADLDRPIRLDVPGTDLWLYSVRAPEKQSENEDAAGAWLLPGAGLVLAVADGLGGAPSGAQAAGLAIRALDAALGALIEGSANGGGEDGDLRVAIIDAFESAHEAILALGVGAGSTLVVVEIRERRLRTYHVGDSAAIVVGQRGRLRLETLSHSPVGYGIAAGLINPKKAIDRPDRHYISNFLGASDMHIQVGSPIVLNARDTLLVTSDGLLDNLRHEEIVSKVRSGPVEGIALELASCVGQRMRGEASSVPGKPDDTSFLLYRARSRA